MFLAVFTFSMARGVPLGAIDVQSHRHLLVRVFICDVQLTQLHVTANGCTLHEVFTAFELIASVPVLCKARLTEGLLPECLIATDQSTHTL